MIRFPAAILSALASAAPPSAIPADCSTDIPPIVGGLVIDETGDGIGDLVLAHPPGEVFQASYETQITGEFVIRQRIHLEWSIHQIADPRDIREARLSLSFESADEGAASTDLLHVTSNTDGLLRALDFDVAVDSTPLWTIDGADPGGRIEIDVTALVRADRAEGTRFFAVQARVAAEDPAPLAAAGARIHTSAYTNPIAIRPTLHIDIQRFCPDLNDDGVINVADVSVLLGVWGGHHDESDVDCSGRVGAVDLAALLGAWGPCDVTGS